MNGPPCRVALLGFNDFERNTLAACLRLSAQPLPRYEATARWQEATLLVAATDHPATLATLAELQHLPRTLCIGDQAPPLAGGWLRRPFERAQVLRALDTLWAQAEHAARLSGQAQAAALGAPATRLANTAAAEPSRHALLVDDSAIALRFLQSRLQRRGVSCTCVGSSQRAWQALHPVDGHSDIGMVMIDVELGQSSHLDGLALCQQIKRRSGQLPRPTLVIVSAHQGPSARARGTLAGCDAYLAKPLDETLLLQVLVRQGWAQHTEPMR